MMLSNKIAALAVLLAVSVSAQDEPVKNPEPITIGRLGIPHGYVMIGWTPTKTTIGDACNNTGTQVIQAVHTNFPSNPLCNFPFEIDGIKNLSLMCDPSKTTEEIPIGISTDGKKTHECVKLPNNVYSTYCGGGASIAQAYACQ